MLHGRLPAEGGLDVLRVMGWLAEVSAACHGQRVTCNGHPARALTPCMPCSFGPFRWSRSAACAQHHGPLEATVTVRQIPPVTTAYGTWVARPARTTMLRRGGARLQLD